MWLCACAFNPFHAAFSDYYCLSIVVTVCCLLVFFFALAISLPLFLARSLILTVRSFLFHLQWTGFFSFNCTILYLYTDTHTSLSVINGVFFHILFRIFVASSILCIWWLNEKKRKRSREARDVMRARKKTEIKIGGATENAIAEEARWIPLSDFDFSSLSSSCVCLLRIAVDAALSICQVE